MEHVPASVRGARDRLGAVSTEQVGGTPEGGVAGAVAALRGALPRATPRAVLREVRADDARAVHGYRGDPATTRFLGHPPLEADQAGALVAQWLTEPAAVTVVAEVDGRVVGEVRLRLRAASAMAPAATGAVEAALGYAFDPRVRGRGLATGCVRDVVALALGTAGVRRVTARVFAPATPSSRLLARLGFSRDGIDRASVLAPDGDTWWDDELWSLLPGELADLPGELTDLPGERAD